MQQRLDKFLDKQASILTVAFSSSGVDLFISHMFGQAVVLFAGAIALGMLVSGLVEGADGIHSYVGMVADAVITVVCIITVVIVKIY